MSNSSIRLAPRRRVMPLITAIAVASLGLTACGSSSGSSSVAADCKPAHKFDTVDEGKLQVGVYELPPYISSQGEGGMSGADADIIRLIAKKECLEVSPKSADFAALVPGIQGGRLDVVGGDIYRTKERAKAVNLTNAVYLDTLAIVTKDGIDTVAGLKGLKVGTVDGYSWNPDLKTVLGDEAIKTYPSSVNMYQDLEAGRIQAGIDAYGSGVYAIKGKDSLKVENAKPDPEVAASVEPAQSAYLLPKDNGAMLEAFNADLEELRADGTLAKILKKWDLDPEAVEVGEPRLLD